MFNNELIKGVHISRIIMSWVRVGGELGKRGEGIDQFRQWLESIGYSTDEIEKIIFVAMNGKLELETSAKKFLKEHNKNE